MTTPLLLIIAGLLFFIAWTERRHEKTMDRWTASFAPPEPLPRFALPPPEPLTPAQILGFDRARHMPFPLVVRKNAGWGELMDLAPTRQMRPPSRLILPLAGPLTTITPRAIIEL